MARPWKIDKNVSRAFTVIRHLDLNSLPPYIHFVSNSLFNQMQYGITLDTGSYFLKHLLSTEMCYIS